MASFSNRIASGLLAASFTLAAAPVQPSPQSFPFLDQQSYDHLNQALANPVHYTDMPVDQSRAIGAPQEGAVMSDANSSRNMIGSSGAGICILMFMRRPEQADPATGQTVPARAAVAHIDATNDLNTLNPLFDKLQSGKPTEVTLISVGLDSGRANEILNYLAAKNVTVKTDLGQMDDATDTATMDIRTGALIRDVAPHDEMNLDLREGSSAPITLLYDGTSPRNDLNASGPTRVAAPAMTPQP